MSRLKRLMVGLLSATALGYGAYLEQRVVLNKPLMEYVDQNIPKVLQSHGKRIGIQDTALPSALYVIPRELKNNDGYHLAGYDSESETIYFDTSKLVAPSNTIDNLILKLVRGKSVENIDGTLNHEGGHHIVNAISKTFNLGPVRRWHNTHETSDKFIFDVPERNRAVKLVQEGMAVYFEKRHGENPDFKGEDWPKNKKEVFERPYSSRFFYDGGHMFVKPIIDKHGLYGILFILRNTPTMEDILNFRAYQKEAIDNLSTDIYYMRKERDLKAEFNKKYEEFSKGNKK